MSRQDRGQPGDPAGIPRRAEPPGGRLGSANAHQFESASLPRRLGAVLYEALLLFAMAVIIGFAFLPLVSPSASPDATLRIPSVFGRTMLFCALVAAAASYYTWCWSDGRRTLPQKTWRVRLVNATGHGLSKRQALLRYAACWVGPLAVLAAYAMFQNVSYRHYAALLLGLNFVWALVDPERKFLHDRVARTSIVKDG